MDDQNSFPSDSELLRAIKTGDEPAQQDAKQKLVEKFTDKLRNSMVARLRKKNCNQPAVHVKGVLSDIWIRVFAYLRDLQDPEKFERWLFAIAVNEANRHLRSCIDGQISSVPITDDSVLPPATISGYYASKDAAIDVERMITYADNISEEFGIIFRLYNEKELGFAEIAQKLGKTEAAVRTQYYRGFAKVRARFKKDDPMVRVDDRTEGET
jgi:RNA polymerase sigma factor (sigma-70 family)